MKRRGALLGGGLLLAAATAQAQTVERARRIGVMMDLAADDSNGQTRIGAFKRELQQLGWSIGRNLWVEYRWRMPDAERQQASARELIALAPDPILGSSSPVVAALQRETRSIPVVFVSVSDPVGQGFVESFARPGGNLTGFTALEPGMSGKWLAMLKEIDPNLRRAAVIMDPANQAEAGQLAALQAAAAVLGLILSPIDARDPAAMERELGAFARTPNGGMVVMAAPTTGVHRELIIALAAQLRLPAVYPYNHFAVAGGLIAYGPDLVDPFRRAAGYVDRILKGVKPADLPVQAPTKLELILNLTTAKALGLTIPTTLLVGADEVIE